MAVYRFRVSFEDNEDVYREIEIKSTQNFEDFHNTIIQSINFDNTHDASFFSSDYLWRKGDEIKLKPINNHGSNHTTDVAIRLMNKCKMASLIEDPHQKFVYVYDPKTAWTFLVELVKIVLDDAKVNYPVCVKTVGEAPKQYKKSTILPVVPDDDEDEFDDEPHGDDDAYVNAHNDDEIAVLEGEEGDEESAETTEEESTEEEDEFGSSDLDDDTENLREED